MRYIAVRMRPETLIGMEIGRYKIYTNSGAIRNFSDRKRFRCVVLRKEVRIYPVVEVKISFACNKAAISMHFGCEFLRYINLTDG